MSNVIEGRFIGKIMPEPAAALRAIADDIEAGKFGKVEVAAVALSGKDVTCFGAGPESTVPMVALLFHDAFHRMQREALWDLRPGSEW